MNDTDVNKETYYNLLMKLERRGYISIVTNNPLEKLVLETNNVFFTQISLIRPFGVTNLEAEEVSKEDQDKCVYLFRSEYDINVVKPAMLAHGITSNELKPISLHYGGPKTLAKYKCWVIIPYQGSIMKM